MHEWSAHHAPVPFGGVSELYLCYYVVWCDVNDVGYVINWMRHVYIYTLQIFV